MEKSKETPKEAAESGSLREAISQARLDEAHEIDGELDMRSSEIARLEILKESLQKLFDDIPRDEDRFELALVPSTPARLWIDMLSYVEMYGDCEYYRLIRNARSGRTVLVETSDVGVMRGRITEYVARQIVARERQLSGLADMPKATGRRRRRVRAGLILAAFVLGALAGAAGLFAAGWVVFR